MDLNQKKKRLSQKQLHQNQEEVIDLYKQQNHS